MSKINEIDLEIAVLERLLANANERRREEVNRTDANKCNHNFRLVHWRSDIRQCTKCHAIIDPDARMKTTVRGK